MTGRRRFIVLGCALAAGSFIQGNFLQIRKTVDHSGSKFVGPPAPQSGGHSVIGNVESTTSTPADAKSVVRKYNAPQIRDLHPDHVIADNVAPTISESHPQPLEEIVITESERMVFEAALIRLSKLQSYVGYGNFNVIGWDQILRIAQNREQIGAFSKAELDFIEQLFFTRAADFGFYGDKVITRLSSTIGKKDILKIAGTGHYLFKGSAVDTYRKIRKDIGDSIVLTSGVRGVVKQLYLFMNKTAKVNGNLSLASYSLAPPGHSYHALGDFDVGKVGWGHKNFSAEFADTDEFKRLFDLGYLDIRYPQNNPFGVRYEPWHIKIA